MKKQKTDRKQSHDRFLTTEEAADFLSLSTTTLQTYRQRETGPVYCQLEDRTIRYRLSDVIQYGCKNVCKTKDSTTSVDKSCFLSLLTYNTKFRNEAQSIINKTQLENEVDGTAQLKKQLAKKHLGKLNWQFDKLTLNFELPEQQGKRLKQKLIEKENIDVVDLLPRNTSYYQNSYRIKLYSKKTVEFLLHYSDTTCGFNYRIQVQLNPSHFNKKHATRLCQVFKVLLGDEYKKVLQDAWVSRFDICFDLPDISHDLVIFRFKRTKKRHLVCSNKSHNTVYKVEGGRRANRCKSYAKNGGTRIEFEFYPGSKMLKLNNLLDHEPPFDRFEIYDPKLLLTKGVHPFAIHAINMIGVKDAIKTINDPKERRLLNKALKQYQIMTDPAQFQRIAERKISLFLKRVVL